MVNRNNSQPMVSVIMSCYNHRKYVGEAIKSVLSQTYTDFEFLIADDGSTDGSVKVIKEYAEDERVTFYESQENTAFKVWEKLNHIAKGKYITYIASDDVWNADKLEKQVSFLESNVEYEACFTWIETIDGDSNIAKPEISLNKLFNTEQKGSAEWYKKLFMEGNSLSAPSFMMRTKVFQKLGGFHFQYRQLQDYELWLRYLLDHKLYVIPEKLVLYRWHENDSTSNISVLSGESIIRNWNETFHIYERQIEMIPDNFFKNAFMDNLLRKKAMTHEEIMCEKFFLMLNHPRIEAQQVGINYYLTHIDEDTFAKCLEETYGFSRADFYIMEVNRGIMKEMRDLEITVEQSKELSNTLISYVKGL